MEITNDEKMAATALDAGITAIKEIEYRVNGLAYALLLVTEDIDGDLLEIAQQLIGRLSESSASLSTFLIDYFDNLEQGVEKNPEALLDELKSCKERGEIMHRMILLDPETRAEVAKKRLEEGIKEWLPKDKGDQSE